MKTTKQTSALRFTRGATLQLALGRVRTMLLTVAAFATLGMTTTALADRVGHDVAAGHIVVSNNVPAGSLPTDAGTEMSLTVAVNGFGFIQNYNISDHKIIIGNTEADDTAGGILIAAISENMRNNRGSNMTHTLSVNPQVNSFLSYEIASQSVPLAAASVASIEDNVNFAAAWFPYATWLGGYAWNGANGQALTNFYGSASLVLGTHFLDSLTNSVVTDNTNNGVYYLDLRSLGIDSRRDGVLLVNHGKNEANYALSRVNNDDDEMDGTWTIYTHDNRVNGRSYEQDPVAFVFVPKGNTDVVSGMFMGDGAIAIHSGVTPAFTVAWRTDIANGTYELKIPGRSPADGILIISAAGGDPNNGDNIVTYQPNTAGDGWIIQSRDLPNAGLQSLPENEAVCSFVFIPAEKPGVTATPNKNLLTTELGGSAQFTVTVNGYPKPTANVSLNLSSSDLGEGTVSPMNLTFTPADWNVPQTVTLTGVDDAIVDGTQPYTINLTATTSADPGFNGLIAGNVGAINIDDEAGVSLDASSITTTEAGGTATFSVWLNTMPTADVTLTLSSSDTTEATVSPASLTFTASDYSTPQVVTVTGVNDFVQDGDAGYFVITATATSADAAYNNFDALDVVGLNLDDDQAGVIVPASKVTISEPNTTAPIALVLASEPTANVTINCTSSDTTEGMVTASVTFTPGNWNVPQNVIVTAADDLVNDGPVEFTIVTTVTSADPLYAAINPDDVAVVTLDNEAAFDLPSGDLVYGLGEPAKGVDGYATLHDPDTANYNTGGLTVTITAGGNLLDILDVRNTGAGAGEIGVSGNTVSYEGAAIGTKSGGTNGVPLVIAFTSTAATPAAAQALIRSVTFANTNASVSSRTISFALADGHGGISTATKTVIIRLMRVSSYQQGADGGFGLYSGALDTQIHHAFPMTPYPAGYSASGLWIDYDTGATLPTDQMQCFVKFADIFGTGPGQIPPGSKIVFAELIMNVSDSGHGARFNRMLGDWDEYVTFESLGDGIQLDNVEAVPGTNSFLGDQAHNTTTGGGLRAVGVTADVQAWSDGASNYGWVMSTWEGGDNGTAFSPCEATNVVLRPRLRVGWVPASAATVASFQGGVGGYAGTVDTQVRLVAPTTSYATSATLSPDWLVSATPIPNQNQVLIRFDNIIGTDAGQVPPGATIHAAVVEFTSIQADAQGAGGLFHALLKDWNATDTWDTWGNGIDTDGIEAAVTATVTLPVAGQGETVQPTRHTVELTADVQAWANGTPNYGWAIMPWPNGNNGWNFNSADNAWVETRPLLRVYYTSNFLDSVTMNMPVVTPTSVQVSFKAGLANTSYFVLRAPDVTGPWTTNGSAMTGSNFEATHTDTAPLAGRAFYRIYRPQ